MRRIVYALLLAAVAGCGPETQPTQPVSAHVLAPPAPHREYLVVKLPSLGGTSLGTGISNGGLVAGFSNVSASVRHAALWRDGGVIDLGTLGGRSSNSQWPGLSNGGGRVVGISYTSTPDTLDEDWSCDAFMPVSDSTCVGFVWENGVMTDLGTLGAGSATSEAVALNERGVVVGSTRSQTGPPRPVLWRDRMIRLLYRGTTYGAVVAINVVHANDAYLEFAEAHGLGPTIIPQPKRRGAYQRERQRGERIFYMGLLRKPQAG